MKNLSMLFVVVFSLLLIIFYDVEAILFPKGSAPQVPVRSYLNRTESSQTASTLPLPEAEITFSDGNLFANSKSVGISASKIPVYQKQINYPRRYRGHSIVSKETNFDRPQPNSEALDTTFGLGSRNIGKSRTGNYQEEFTTQSKDRLKERPDNTIPSSGITAEPVISLEPDTGFSSPLAPETGNEILDDSEVPVGSNELSNKPKFGKESFNFNYIPPVFQDGVEKLPIGKEPLLESYDYENWQLNDNNTQDQQQDFVRLDNQGQQARNTDMLPPALPKYQFEGAEEEGPGESSKIIAEVYDTQPVGGEEVETFRNETPTEATTFAESAVPATLLAEFKDLVAEVLNIHLSPSGALNPVVHDNPKFKIENSGGEGNDSELVGQSNEVSEKNADFIKEEAMSGVTNLLEIENLKTGEQNSGTESLSNDVVEQSDAKNADQQNIKRSPSNSEIEFLDDGDKSVQSQDLLDNSQVWKTKGASRESESAPITLPNTEETIDTSDVQVIESEPNNPETPVSERSYQSVTNSEEKLDSNPTFLNIDSTKLLNSSELVRSGNTAEQSAYFPIPTSNESINVGGKLIQPVKNDQSGGITKSDNPLNNPMIFQLDLPQFRQDHTNTGNTLFSRNPVYKSFNPNHYNKIEGRTAGIPQMVDNYRRYMNSYLDPRIEVRSQQPIHHIAIPSFDGDRPGSPTSYLPTMPVNPDSNHGRFDDVLNPYTDRSVENSKYFRYGDSPESRSDIYLPRTARYGGQSGLQHRENNPYYIYQRNDGMYPSLAPPKTPSKFYEASPHYFKRSVNPYEYIRGQSNANLENLQGLEDPYPSGISRNFGMKNIYPSGRTRYAYRPDTESSSFDEHANIDLDKVMDSFRSKAAVSIPLNKDDWKQLSLLDPQNKAQSNQDPNVKPFFPQPYHGGQSEGKFGVPDNLLSCIRAAKRCKYFKKFENFCFLDCFTKKTGRRVKRSDGVSVSILNKLINSIQMSMHSLCGPPKTIYTSLKFPGETNLPSLNANFVDGLADSLVSFVIENSNTDFTALRTVTRQMDVSNGAHWVSRASSKWKIVKGSPSCRLNNHGAGFYGPASKLASLIEQNMALADILLPGYMVTSSAALINSGTGSNYFSYVKDVMDKILGINCGLLYFGRTQNDWPACPPDNYDSDLATRTASFTCSPKKIFKYVYVYKNGTRLPNQVPYQHNKS